MKRIKIFENSSHEKLEQEINEFIKNNGCKVRKIIFNSSTYENNAVIYSALLYYEELIDINKEGEKEFVKIFVNNIPWLLKDNVDKFIYSHSCDVKDIYFNSSVDNEYGTITYNIMLWYKLPN